MGALDARVSALCLSVCLSVCLSLSFVSSCLLGKEQYNVNIYVYTYIYIYIYVCVCTFYSLNCMYSIRAHVFVQLVLLFVYV